VNKVQDRRGNALLAREARREVIIEKIEEVHEIL
jgi:hypothetical protein